MRKRFNVQWAEGIIPVFSGSLGSWRIEVQRAPFSVAELTRLYDRAAPWWGRMVDRLGYPGVYETLLRKMLKEEPLYNTDVWPCVLDCGVGTGALSSALARVLGKRIKLDAIDLSPRMLERAGGNLRRAGLEVILRRGDVRALPFGDGVFDFSMTAHVLEHLADPSAALKEMVRVLKPGGLLMACLTRRSLAGMIVQLKWRTHRMTPAQAESLLRESGLENVRCLPLGYHALCKRLSVACVGRKPALANVSSEMLRPVEA